jgi:endonuclease-8
MPAPPLRETVRLRLATRKVAWDLIGPPTCEIVTREEYAAILARLGPDILSPRPDMRLVLERLRRTDAAIANALLDQRIVSGIGNIYRAEALFLNGLHPLRPASSLTMDELESLWTTVRRMMRRGVARPRMSTIEPADRTRARRSDPDGRSFYVYGETLCLRCGNPVRSFPLSGRTMYACPVCQPTTTSIRRGARTRSFVRAGI